MNQLKTFEGHFNVKGARFALVCSRFNSFIVDALEGLAARDPRALQPSMEAEAAALLSTFRRDINKVASAKRVASLFESA